MLSRLETTPMSAVAPAVLDPRDAARYIGVGRMKCVVLLRDREIPAKKAGKHTLVRVRDLDARIDALPDGRPKR